MSKHSKIYPLSSLRRTTAVFGNFAIWGLDGQSSKHVTQIGALTKTFNNIFLLPSTPGQQPLNHGTMSFP